MTTQEMINAFKIGYDIANYAGPSYENEEILVFLNKAQVIEVLKEVALKRLTYLNNIIKNDRLSTSASGLVDYNYVRTVTPSTKYLAHISSHSKVTRITFKPTNGAEWISNIKVTKADSVRYISSTLNYLILLQPRIFEDEGGVLSVIHDRHTSFSGTNDLSLEYVRKPIDIAVGVNCEVNEILHERIVNTAVDIAKKVFNPQEAAVSQQADMLMDKPEL